MVGTAGRESGGTRARLLDVAEHLIRQRGYHGVSTRDVAGAVGIKAASAHHHFPTKAALGEAVATRYQTRFLQALGPPEAFQGDELAAFDAFADAFRRSLREDGSLCLCGVLGAESGGLPEEVTAAARRFFAACSDWLVAAFAGEARAAGKDDRERDLATHALATLEGAMLLAQALEDNHAFERAVRSFRTALVTIAT